MGGWEGGKGGEARKVEGGEARKVGGQERLGSKKGGKAGKQERWEGGKGWEVRKAGGREGGEVRKAGITRKRESRSKQNWTGAGK